MPGRLFGNQFLFLGCHQTVRQLGQSLFFSFLFRLSSLLSFSYTIVNRSLVSRPRASHVPSYARAC